MIPLSSPMDPGCPTVGNPPQPVTPVLCLMEVVGTVVMCQALRVEPKRRPVRVNGKVLLSQRRKKRNTNRARRKNEAINAGRPVMEIIIIITNENMPRKHQVSYEPDGIFLLVLISHLSHHWKFQNCKQNERLCIMPFQKKSILCESLLFCHYSDYRVQCQRQI